MTAGTAMRFAGARGIVVIAIALLAAADDRIAAAEPLEIFDAHLHYNWEPQPYYRLEEVLALLRKHRVTGILATSRPNTGTHALVDAKADGLQVVPFIRPYRVRADIGSWFSDPVIFDLVQDEFKRGYYRGIGEFHLSGKSAENEWVKKTVDFAVANNLYLHAHADEEAVEILMRHNPRARIIWAYRLRPAHRTCFGDAGQISGSLGRTVLPRRDHRRGGETDARMAGTVRAIP
jgi:hypothetical protein